MQREQPPSPIIINGCRPLAITKAEFFRALRSPRIGQRALYWTRRGRPFVKILRQGGRLHALIDTLSAEIFYADLLDGKCQPPPCPVSARDLVPNEEDLRLGKPGRITSIPSLTDCPADLLERKASPGPPPQQQSHLGAGQTWGTGAIYLSLEAGGNCPGVPPGQFGGDKMACRIGILRSSKLRIRLLDTPSPRVLPGNPHHPFH